MATKTGDLVAPIDRLVTFIRAKPSAWPCATLATVLAILRHRARSACEGLSS